MSEEEKIPPEEIPQAQPVKKEPADENISSAESIDETEQLQIEQSEIPMTIGTTNYKPQTENMEVHKHPHHVTHKKKWGEYLLEFLMIFLAVFLGFVAENIRENSVEKERGKEYINTLVEDIQLDITDLKKQIEFREIVEKRIDSLFDLFQKPDRKNFTAEIYFLSRRTTRASNLSYHDRTIQQLKNSGALRLIHNKGVLNDIILYDGQVRSLLNQHQVEDVIRQNIRNLLGKVFDVFVVHNMENFVGDSLILNKPENNPPLLSNNPEVINELLNQEQYLKGVYTVTRTLEKKLIAAGNNLISLVKKEYHLENE